MSAPRPADPGVTVTEAEIRRIAALARLRLGRGEVERMARDMSSILEHMAVLEEARVDPASGAPGDDATRTDAGASADAGPPADGAEPTPDPLRRPISRMAPDWRDGFFVVPRPPGVGDAPNDPDGSP